MPQATNLVDLYMEHKLAEDNLVSWSFKNFKRYKCNSYMTCYAIFICSFIAMTCCYAFPFIHRHDMLIFENNMYLILGTSR